MFWVRLILSLTAGLATGTGVGFLGLGLLPTFPSVESPARPDRAVLTDERAIVLAMTEDPHVKAEKRRTATAAGVGSLVGAVTMLVVFVRSRRWCEARRPAPAPSTGCTQN
jgi:hypothetical protein